MSQTDSVQGLVKQFIGKENENVTVEYRGQSYSVSPKGIVSIENQLPHITEVIGGDDDYRDEMVHPIIVAQITAVRLALLQQLKVLNIGQVTQALKGKSSKLHTNNENIVDDVNDALNAVKAAAKPTLSQATFGLFNPKPAVSTLDRVYHALEDIDAIKTYADVQQVMSEISGQSNQPPRMTAS